MPLSEILTGTLIRQMAGSRSYARSAGYYVEDRIVHLSELNEKISATVAGTRHYRVRLWEDGAGLGYSCDCPVRLRDEFCKHCVATALAWVELLSGSGNMTATIKVGTHLPRMS